MICNPAGAVLGSVVCEGVPEVRRACREMIPIRVPATQIYL